jgi:hypothetical protein
MGLERSLDLHTLRQPGAHSDGMERMDSVEAMKQFERMVEPKRVEGVGPLPARLPVAHNFSYSGCVNTRPT